MMQKVKDWWCKATTPLSAHQWEDEPDGGGGYTTGKTSRGNDGGLDDDLRGLHTDPPRVQQSPEVKPPSMVKEPTLDGERLGFGQAILPPGPLPYTMVIQLFMDKDGKYCSLQDVYFKWMTYKMMVEDAKKSIAGTGVADDGNPFITLLSLKEYVESAGFKPIARYYDPEKGEIVCANSSETTPSEAQQQDARDAMSKWIESVTAAQAAKEAPAAQKTEQKDPTADKVDSTSLQQIMEEIHCLRESVAALTPTPASEAAEQPAAPSRSATRPERP